MDLSHMKASSKNDNKIVCGIILFCSCLIYAILQIYLNFHQMITPDQFWFVSSIYQKYRIYVPYRDFVPYKSVMGYYFLSIPMMLVNNPFYTFVYIKNFITIYNAIFLFIGAMWMTKLYSFRATIISMTLLISSFFFINITNDIRTDIFGYWLCLMSVLFLLENKFTLAGVMLGIAFCFSQKALWYLFASDCALVVTWIAFLKTWRGMRHIIIFNSSFICILLAYIGVWSAISSFQAVLNGLFYDAIAVYNIQIYQTDHLYYIGMVLKDDVLYCTLWILVMCSIFIIPDQAQQKRRVFVFVYACTFMLLILSYKQPFGYFTVAVIPALFLLYTDFFYWFIGLYKWQAGFPTGTTLKLYFNPLELIFLMIFCTLLYIYVPILIPILPYSYSLVCLLPILLGLYVISIHHHVQGSRSMLSRLLAGLFCFVLVGETLLSARNMLHFLPLNGYQYQRQVLGLVHDLTQDGSTYVAGIDLLFDKKQPISGNSYLLQNTLYLLHPDAELKKSMLSSLDLDPEITIQKMIDSISAEPVKIFVNSIFIIKIPALLSFLNSNYEHLWGNVYIYSPHVSAGSHKIPIKFIGHYQVQSKTPIVLNGTKVYPGTVIYISKKYIHSVSSSIYRLKLIPDQIPKLQAKYATDIPSRLTSECSYLFVNGRYKCIYME